MKSSMGKTKRPKFTCMAPKVDKKSLHCSSKTRSFAVTFTSSVTKAFVSSTCEWQMVLHILLDLLIWDEVKHMQMAFSQPIWNKHFYTVHFFSIYQRLNKIWIGLFSNIKVDNCSKDLKTKFLTVNRNGCHTGTVLQ